MRLAGSVDGMTRAALLELSRFPKLSSLLASQRPARLLARESSCLQEIPVNMFDGVPSWRGLV